MPSPACYCQPRPHRPEAVSCLGGGWRTFGLILALLPGLAGGAAPSSALLSVPVSPSTVRPPEGFRVAHGPDSATQDAAVRILQVAYARAGLNLQAETLPAPRATQRLEAGRLDGDAARIAPYFDAHPMLQRVAPRSCAYRRWPTPVPMPASPFAAWPTFVDAGWASCAA